MDFTLFFKKLVAILQLGEQLSDIVSVSGGFMHTMYKLVTDKDTYIVKLLNPNVMKRPEAFNNYSEADRLECIIENNNIPIVPSLTFNNNKMQEIDGQYFYVYKWYDGKSLNNADITRLNCCKISKTLSEIHHIDVRYEKYNRTPINIDWDYYITLAKEQNTLVYDLLSANKNLLYESQMNGNAAITNIPAVMTICHNDMDSKNVLWLGDDFKIIDLECLGYSNPYLELFELALCWSGYSSCNLDFELFYTFIHTYFENKPKLNIDWLAIYYCNYGRLEWLEYNIKRALLIECNNSEEQQLSIEQVKLTVENVIYYHKIQNDILDCLKNIFIN